MGHYLMLTEGGYGVGLRVCRGVLVRLSGVMLTIS